MKEDEVMRILVSFSAEMSIFVCVGVGVRAFFPLDPSDALSICRKA